MSPAQIRQLRKALSLTQQQLADLIGAQRHTVARWETGINEPKGANLKQLRQLVAEIQLKAKRAKGKTRKGPKYERKR